jgi:hypothetical protein
MYFTNVVSLGDLPQFTATSGVGISSYSFPLLPLGREGIIRCFDVVFGFGFLFQEVLSMSVF